MVIKMNQQLEYMALDYFINYQIRAKLFITYLKYIAECVILLIINRSLK